MFRVAVVGGGAAGVEAAAEASARGARVTLIEKDVDSGRPWKLWPEVIGATGMDAEPPRQHWFTGRWEPAELLTSVATGTGPGYVDTASGRVQSDFTIVATGSRFERPGIQGIRKEGVMTLDSVSAYEGLGRLSESSGRILVTGEGVRSLEVAERLARRGKPPGVVASAWQPRAPSPDILGVLSDAACSRGVSIRHGTVTRALGAGGLEAVLMDGEVVNCDALAVAPMRVPNVVPTRARLGPSGGVLVDSRLQSSEPATFAAGSCAEQEGASTPITLGEDPLLSGRVAASNCLGESFRMGVRTAWERVVFGIRWTWFRLRAANEPSPRGRRRMSKRWDRRTACEIIFEEEDGRILAIETAEAATSKSSRLPPSSTRTTLSSLAYGRFGSSDITLVSDTARLALREWQRCWSATTSKWRSSPLGPVSRSTTGQP